MRSSVLVLGAILFAPAVAHADVQHTVARGHTIEAIANRYKVSAKSIIEANHLKDVKHLRVGDVLTIPKVDPPASKAKTGAEKGDKKDLKTAKLDADKKGPKGKPAETTTYAMKAKTPGVVHVKRLATTEEQDIRIADRRGRVSPTALKAFEKLLRSPSGMSHPIEARLVQLLGVVSNHFGSRKIEVVSGFRPYTPTQYNPHSNHMHGKAVDFRVVGVPNEAVRDFCRTLKNVGCGYYPNSVFVHMDAREQSTYWVDWSKPGQRPNYSGPDVGADEGASEVHDEVHRETGATPTHATDNATDNGPPAATDNAPPAATAPATGASDVPKAAPSAPAKVPPSADE